MRGGGDVTRSGGQLLVDSIALQHISHVSLIIYHQCIYIDVVNLKLILIVALTFSSCMDQAIIQYFKVIYSTHTCILYI